MSTSTPPPTSILISNPPAPISQNLSTLGLGYSIAIAFAFLVLLSTILLASYVCCRAATTARSNNNNNITNTGSSSDNGIIVPRFVFVDDSDDTNSGNGNSSSTVGLDQVVINSYPKFTFSKMNKQLRSGEEASCSICLCDYREAEMLRVMPDCRHFFHLTCLDAWLRLNGSCPVCRNSPLPTPLSTPLAEVVPLAQYAAYRARSS